MTSGVGCQAKFGVCPRPPQNSWRSKNFLNQDTKASKTLPDILKSSKRGLGAPQPSTITRGRASCSLHIAPSFPTSVAVYSTLKSRDFSVCDPPPRQGAGRDHCQQPACSLPQEALGGCWGGCSWELGKGATASWERPGLGLHGCGEDV